MAAHRHGRNRDDGLSQWHRATEALELWLRRRHYLHLGEANVESSLNLWLRHRRDPERRPGRARGGFDGAVRFGELAEQAPQQTVPLGAAIAPTGRLCGSWPQHRVSRREPPMLRNQFEREPLQILRFRYRRNDRMVRRLAVRRDTAEDFSRVECRRKDHVLEEIRVLVMRA